MICIVYKEGSNVSYFLVWFVTSTTSSYPNESGLSFFLFFYFKVICGLSVFCSMIWVSLVLPLSWFHDSFRKRQLWVSKPFHSRSASEHLLRVSQDLSLSAFTFNVRVFKCLGMNLTPFTQLVFGELLWHVCMCHLRMAQQKLFTSLHFLCCCIYW